MATDPAIPSTDPGRTRTSTAWRGVAVGLVLSLLMVVFILQNGDDVDLEFLWLEFTVPIGVGLLLAAVVGGLVVTTLGLARMLQLRRAARRHERAERAERRQRAERVDRAG